MLHAAVCSRNMLSRLVPMPGDEQGERTRPGIETNVPTTWFYLRTVARTMVAASDSASNKLLPGVGRFTESSGPLPYKLNFSRVSFDEASRPKSWRQRPASLIVTRI
jgi:hypothetical protein